MFEQVGHKVEKIKRVKYGPLVLDVLPGKVRPLTTAEVADLAASAGKRPRFGAGQKRAPKRSGRRS
jgi:23S rRNA pseudouridine2605 synthase